ncbi:MAG: biotin--[acetyl-CoA-carboxylase] ligase [Acidobacteria bacterium]|nr:MAG: biotin--[acetyl-CoA-carboxylase] ligase [Acidobacteriota bacterium]
MPFDIARVRARLPGRRIDWFASVSSTMTPAARLARDGCSSGTIVGADEQVAGIGRHGRVWHSEAEGGLYVSMILRLGASGGALPVMMLALGVGVRDAIAEVTGLAPDLRWPNDVLLNSRKCAGILAQLEGEAVIAGIGINVNQTRFPQEFELLATSLALEGKPGVAREELLVAVVNSVEHCCKILTEEGSAAILRMFSCASSYVEGRRVNVKQGAEVIEGVTCGLDPSGFLLVRQDNGRQTTILAGGVRPV